MKRILIAVLMVLGCASQSWAFGAAIQAVLATGDVSVGCSKSILSISAIGTYVQSADLYTDNRFLFPASPSSTSVCAITLYLIKHSSETSNFTLEIRTDDAGYASETVLGTSDVVLNSSVETTLTTVLFSFSSPVTLTANTVYHMVLRKVGTTTGYNLNISINDGATESMNRSATGLTGSWTNIGNTKSFATIITGM